MLKPYILNLIRGMTVTHLIPRILNPRLKRWREITYLSNLAVSRNMTFDDRHDCVAVRNGDREIRLSKENHVYAQDIIFNFDYYFDVVEPTQVGGMEVVDYSQPRLHVMREDGYCFWFPSLPESMSTTRIYLDKADIRPGQTVFDMGAYAGGATYHFSRAVGEAGRVFAFEPDARSQTCLQRNIELHCLANVTLVKAGVWSYSGRVNFQAEGNMGSAIVDAADRDSDTVEGIDVISLDDFCATHAIEEVHFVKMDVEGSEAAILASAGDFIERYHPTFVIEPHRVRGVLTDAEVTRILRGHGYNVECVPQADLPLPLLFARPR